MATHGPGSVVRRRRRRWGRVAWPTVAGALRAQGWAWWLPAEEDTDPGAGQAAFPLAFADGWLTLGPTGGGDELGEARADALAAHLAAVGGHPVVMRLEDAELRPRPDAVELAVWVVERGFGPDGGQLAPREVASSDAAYDLHGDWLSDDAADAVAATAWAAVPLPEGAAPGGDLAPRAGFVRPAAKAAWPVGGPAVVVAGVAFEPAARVALEQALRRAGALDEEASPPDLTRWRERAARRLGLVDVPPAGSAAHAAWEDAVLELSRADRSQPGRDGRVAGWKLRTAGRWVLGAREVGRIGAAAGVPDTLRGRTHEREWEVVVGPTPDR